jgi:hypothetical protein
MAIDNPLAHSPNRILSIPEFFIFGHITSPQEESSFVFNNFSADKQGRALCIMNLNENNRQIKYTLRFDQSAGEPLIHVDYSYYDKSEIKLIAHKILNFEEIYRFSTRLFIAMMTAGIFDAYFSTLVKGGIKGLTELAKKNPAFLYPYYWLWMIEEFTMKLNVRQDAYRILKKLYEGVSLEQDEKVFIKNIEYGDFSVTAKDEQGNIIGLSRLGYAVLMRYRRGQNTIRAT